MGQKGSGYERDFCRRLSLWWSGGPKHGRDDLFWRSSMSGGRATVRGRKGKTTAGHYGDIAATDPMGAGLLKVFAVECKCGYNKKSTSIGDLLDVPEGGAIQELGAWIKQSRKAARLAGASYWLLAHKKDRREEVIYMPRPAFDFFMKGQLFGPFVLNRQLISPDTLELFVEFQGPLRIGKTKTIDVHFVAMRSSSFFGRRPKDAISFCDRKGRVEK